MYLRATYLQIGFGRADRFAPCQLDGQCLSIYCVEKTKTKAEKDKHRDIFEIQNVSDSMIHY